jgi:hypothetical protein
MMGFSDVNLRARMELPRYKIDNKKEVIFIFEKSV